MTRETVLAAARAFLTPSLVDACTIQHPTGNSTNTTTGVVITTYSTVYAGPCKLAGGMTAAGQDIAEAHVAVLTPILDVPVEVVGVVEGDVVTMTACSFDAEIVGRVFRIQGPAHKSFASARRFQCTEITS